MKNCNWSLYSDAMQKYHDNEWCRPNYDDRYMFELLALEGAQAGLSWSIVINKRETYKEAFFNFDIKKCSTLTDEDLDNIKNKYNIIKNRLKILSVRTNSIAILKVQSEFGSFSNYLWSFCKQPIINEWDSELQMPALNDLSKTISKDLLKRGFKFVGPTIIYSYMQAIGMVDDHIKTCQYHTYNRSVNSG